MSLFFLFLLFLPTPPHPTPPHPQDEPSSGLDSTTALTVCSALKDLTTQGICTVVCTIHQPQRKIFDLFDNLILMKKGQIVYQGACQKSLLFLEMIGKPCPADMNPADFLIDAITQKVGGVVISG